jgi:hypothetical protein
MFSDHLCLVNNGDEPIVSGGDTMDLHWAQVDTGPNLTFSWGDPAPSGLADTTFWIRAYNATDGGGLGKISPGLRGQPLGITKERSIPCFIVTVFTPPIG